MLLVVTIFQQFFIRGELLYLYLFWHTKEVATRNIQLCILKYKQSDEEALGKLPIKSLYVIRPNQTTYELYHLHGCEIMALNKVDSINVNEIQFMKTLSMLLNWKRKRRELVKPVIVSVASYIGLK